MKKRGISAILNELMYLVIAAILIIAIVNAWARISVEADKAEKFDSIQNFNILVSQVSGLAKSSDTFVSTEDHPLQFSLSGDWVVVGFDAEYKEKIKSHCQPWENHETITKPEQCGEQWACLCLWEKGGHNTFDDNGDVDDDLYTCYPIPGLHKIVTYYCGGDEDWWNNEDVHEKSFKECVDFFGYKEPADNIWKNIQGGYQSQNDFFSYADEYNSVYYAPLVYFGECDAYSNDERIGPQPLYIEVFHDYEGKYGNKKPKGYTTAIIYPYYKSFDERWKYLNEKFPKGGNIHQNIESIKQEGGDWRKIVAETFLDREKRDELAGGNVYYLIDDLYSNTDYFKEKSNYGTFVFELWHKKAMLNFLTVKISEMRDSPAKKDALKKANELIKIAEESMKEFKILDIVNLAENDELEYRLRDIVKWMMDNENEVKSWLNITTIYWKEGDSYTKEEGKPLGKRIFDPEKKKEIIQKIYDEYIAVIGNEEEIYAEEKFLDRILK